MTMLNLQLPLTAEKDLAQLAKYSGQSLNDYAKEALLAHLENIRQHTQWKTHDSDKSNKPNKALQDAFGLWADNAEVTDGLSYQQQLRDEWSG